VTNKSIIR